MEVGRIDPSLPFIKRESVAALTAGYADKPSALAQIEDDLKAFYRDNYPDVSLEEGDTLSMAISALQEIYTASFFPEMKVDWRSYPDNIGHLNTPGCLRCHDGQHVNANNKAIGSTCDVCHTFFNPVDGISGAMAEGDFVHPMDLTLHQNLRCTQCHTGGPLPQCRDCHASGEWLENFQKGQFTADK
jgi:hypothetical protein